MDLSSDEEDEEVWVKTEVKSGKKVHFSSKRPT